MNEKNNNETTPTTETPENETTDQTKEQADLGGGGSGCHKSEVVEAQGRFTRFKNALKSREAWNYVYGIGGAAVASAFLYSIARATVSESSKVVAANNLLLDAMENINPDDLAKAITKNPSVLSNTDG